MEQQQNPPPELSYGIQCPSCGFYIAKFQLELKFVPTYTCPGCGNDAPGDGELSRI